MLNLAQVKSGFFFSLHLFVTLLAWVAPFLFSWKFLVPAYALVLLQFQVFGRCLMNQQHGLQETDDRTFYSDLLRRAGFTPNNRLVKVLVRQYLYILLALIAVMWQAGFAHSPLLF